MASRDDGFARIDAGVTIFTENKLSAYAEHRGRFSGGSESHCLFVTILVAFGGGTSQWGGIPAPPSRGAPR